MRSPKWLPKWSDGCTGIPDGPGYVWRPCCVMHDWHYRNIRHLLAEKKIGWFRAFVLRRGADWGLGRCIQRRGYLVTGAFVALGVRVVGWLPLYFTGGNCDDCDL